MTRYFYLCTLDVIRNFTHVFRYFIITRNPKKTYIWHTLSSQLPIRSSTKFATYFWIVVHTNQGFTYTILVRCRICRPIYHQIVAKFQQIRHLVRCRICPIQRLGVQLSYHRIVAKFPKIRHLTRCRICRNFATIR